MDKEIITFVDIETVYIDNVLVSNKISPDYKL